MPMNPKNIINLLHYAFENPVYNIESKITDEERSFASNLIDIIQQSCDHRLFIETYDTLAYNEESVITEAVAIEEDSDENIQNFVENNENLQSEDNIDFDYKQRAVAFWRSGKRKRRSLESVQSKFSKVKHQRMLYRWQDQISQGGSRLEKLLNISEYVLNEFNSASDKRLAIHDTNLKRWALKARENVQLSPNLFKASAKWLHNFKVKHEIVSRKINKFITTAQLSNTSKSLQKADEFVEEVREEIKVKGVTNVYNSDQSGFNLEAHAGRTLSIKGTVKVECLAQSLNSLTHSYTIQPIISADGKLHSPLLIVLQVSDGQFGPTVQKNMYKAENISVYPSKSGKLTSKIAVEWFEKDFLSIAGKDSLLLLDSWSGQTEKVFEKINKGNKIIKINTIPAGTTGFIQPLDVYAFRPWKNFIKCFSDTVLLYNFEINLHLRNNILKLQSLTHNQFSSPRFVNMFKYAWWKSGYIPDKPDKCETPVQFCFQNADADCAHCSQFAVIKCSWCSENLCIQHFFGINEENSPHYCKKYVK